MSAERLKEMFCKMMLKKDISQVPRCYHPDFVLETNGQRQGYAEFLAGHQRVYDTSITCAVRYDESSWVEAGDKVAVRLWITTRRPDQDAVKFEVVLIAIYAGGLIHRLLELTWPDWMRVKALQTY